MNNLVTGGAGFIGSHLVEYLVKKGETVTVIDNLRTGKKKHLESVLNMIDFIEGDIRNYEFVDQIIKNVDRVFHQAALASVPESFTNSKEYFDVNVIGTENIFKSAKNYDCKIVYASSSSVYGNPIEIPITEEHPRNPINPYAKTKLEDEILSERYCLQGSKIIGLRYFNVFGERQSKEYAGVIKKFLENIYDNKPPIINGDGLQTRDFVYVEDVVKANIMAMESDVTCGFFNIGTGSAITISHLADVIVKESKSILKSIHGPELKGDIKESKADITLAKRLFNWYPRVSLEDWLKIAISSRLI